MNLTPHEYEVLEMMNGERPGEWGAWVGACLEFLQEGGYCTRGPSYQITDKGRVALRARAASAADRRERSGTECR
jgi:hypothetical protein